jgi:hypothetical protein
MVPAAVLHKKREGKNVQQMRGISIPQDRYGLVPTVNSKFSSEISSRSNNLAAGQGDPYNLFLASMKDLGAL